MGPFQRNSTLSSEIRNVGPFSSLRVGGVFKVIVHVELDDNSTVPVVELSGEKHLVSGIILTGKGDVLDISHERENLQTNHPLKVEIWTPSAFVKADISGCASFEAEGIEGESFSLSNSGVSSSILQGDVVSFKANLCGTSSVDSTKLLSQGATVTVSGCAKISLSCSSILNAQVLGCGEVNSHQRPKNVLVNTSGLGKVIVGGKVIK